MDNMNHEMDIRKSFHMSININELDFIDILDSEILIRRDLEAIALSINIDRFLDSLTSRRTSVSELSAAMITKSITREMQKKDTEKYDFSYRICRPRSLPAGIKKTYNSLTVVRLQVDALSATVCYDMLCCIFQWSMSGMMGAYRCILTQKRHDCAPFGGQSDINAYDHI